MDLEKIIVSVLTNNSPLSIPQIADALSSRGITVKTKDIYSCLWSMERKGLVKRIYDDDFDILKPARTVKWRLTEEAHVEKIPDDIGSLQLVLAVPPTLGDFKEYCSRYRALYFLEALEAVVTSTENELRIMCPYIDATLLNLLIRADGVRKGKVTVKIISEKRKFSFTTLEYLKVALNNVYVKYADKYDKSRERKLFGVHAKCASADEKLLLLGSFNITTVHIATNLDIGVLISGFPVKIFNKIFDDLWSILPD